MRITGTGNHIATGGTMRSILILNLRPFSDRYLTEIQSKLEEFNCPKRYWESIFAWIVEESILQSSWGNIRFTEDTYRNDYSGLGKTIFQYLGTTTRFMCEMLGNYGIVLVPHRQIKTIVTYDDLVILITGNKHDYYF